MSVYVDDLASCVPTKKYPYRLSCHLFGDSQDELTGFAVRIGLKPEWIQRSRAGILHYDLTPKMRGMAIRFGAYQLRGKKLRAFLESARARKEEGNAG